MMTKSDNDRPLRPGEFNDVQLLRDSVTSRCFDELSARTGLDKDGLFYVIRPLTDYTHPHGPASEDKENTKARRDFQTIFDILNTAAAAESAPHTDHACHYWLHCFARKIKEDDAFSWFLDEAFRSEWLIKPRNKRQALLSRLGWNWSVTADRNTLAYISIVVGNWPPILGTRIETECMTQGFDDAIKAEREILRTENANLRKSREKLRGIVP
ncbi:MAG: hypothetical protein HRU17_14640 [Polyangiaceae bacterium]|nr:hypothetical protein [Polyangiaceae bacterium]